MAKKECCKCEWFDTCKDDKSPCQYYSLKKVDVKKKSEVEHDIQNEIIEYLNLQDFTVLRVNGSSRGNIKSYYLHSQYHKTVSKGFPDLLAIKDNRCVGFEVKTATGKVSDYQEKVREIMKIDMKIYIVSSLEQVVDLIVHDKIFRVQ
jgi:Holliday junction resolvase